MHQHARSHPLCVTHTGPVHTHARSPLRSRTRRDGARPLTPCPPRAWRTRHVSQGASGPTGPAGVTTSRLSASGAEGPASLLQLELPEGFGGPWFPGSVTAVNQPAPAYSLTLDGSGERIPAIFARALRAAPGKPRLATLFTKGQRVQRQQHSHHAGGHDVVAGTDIYILRLKQHASAHKKVVPVGPHEQDLA